MKAQIVDRKSQIAAFLFSVVLLLPPVLWAVEPLPVKLNDAADFKLLDLTGRELSFSASSGRPALLFFWATWCPFCLKELPDLQKQYQGLKKAGVEVFAIDVGEPKERVEKFLGKKNNLEFPVLLDSDSRVASRYNLVGIPTFILIDAQGKIKVRGHSLPRDYEQLLK